MIKLSALLVLLGAASLCLPEAARGEVFCLSQNPADGRFRGSILAREECIGDELEIGSVVDAEAGILEFNGVEVELPPQFRADWNATLTEVEAVPQPTPDDEPPADQDEEEESE